MLFYREFFVAVYELLFGEKLRQKLCLWRKKDKYHVCYSFASNCSKTSTSASVCPVINLRAGLKEGIHIFHCLVKYPSPQIWLLLAGFGIAGSLKTWNWGFLCKSLPGTFYDSDWRGWYITLTKQWALCLNKEICLQFSWFFCLSSSHCEGRKSIIQQYILSKHSHCSVFFLLFTYSCVFSQWDIVKTISLLNF